MESNTNYENLLKAGFIQEQIEYLRQLRYMYIERERVQITIERRRLEFARWLVSTGHLTDEISETRPL